MGPRTPKGSTQIEQLRRDAEAMLAIHPHVIPPSRVSSPKDQTELVHELEVHQVELEMQNDELRRAQFELANARDRYHELYDLAPIAYLTLDRTSTILEANLAACQLLRRDRSRLVGSRLSSFLAPAETDTFHRFRAAVFERGTRQTSELALMIDGRRVPMHVDALAVATPEPHVCRCVLVDLSELRAAQDEARAQAARIQMMFDTAPSAIVGVDEAGHIETFSGAAERLFGYRADEVLGRHIHRLVPSLRELAPRKIRTAIGRCKDGSTRALLVSIGEWHDRGMRKRTVILHDQTEQDLAERVRRESEDRFREIAETIDDVFYARERDGALSYASPAYERLRGEPIAKLYERRELGSEAVHPEDRARIVECCRRLLKGEPYNEEFRLLRSDGTIRWVRDRAFPIYDEHGQPQRFVGVIHDLTVERDLELALRQAQKMEAVGALASGVAHDINNVLQVVFGVAELAADGSLPVDRLRVQMRRIGSAAQRGADLVHRLMAFARKERIMPKPLQLDLVVSDSVKLVRRLVTEQVKVSVDLRAPACFVLADAVQIEQILLNLATNARDAMPEGGSLTIETRVVSPSRVSGHSLKPAFRYTRIIVRDTGAGMDEATRTRLFEPFFTTKEIGKGTGLGLATVYAVTRELGADIEVESAPGQGTTFALTIPCCDSPTSVTEDLTAAPVVLHGTVLLVDDDPAVRSTVRGYLETTGLEVIEASTVEEALQLHATADTIVTDVVMPTMSGPRLVAEIRRTRPGIRALYISAHPLDYLVEAKTLDRGAAFVQKPFSKEQLASALATVIG